MKYYIIAGEASGDLHGSNLIKALKKTDHNAEFRAWGGDMMQAAGAEIVKHYRDLAFMGFAEVVMNLHTILNNLSFCKKDILNYKPDALILIDYPGFNLRIARWAKTQGLKIIYYISPQVWAWKENRVKTIKECVDEMLVILPFEKAFYQKWHYDVTYVGHPLVEVIDEYSKKDASENSILSSIQKPIIALLPGSRKQEILKKLPVMLEVSRHFTNYQFVVAKAPGQDDSFYNELLNQYPDVKSVSGKTYDLLLHAKAALVTSGTATLETALFSVPEVVCYKGSPISYAIAKRVIKIKYISLVNLIMDKPVVKELIQHDLTTANIITELRDILYNPVRIEQLKTDYRQLRDILSRGGHASDNAARAISSFLQGEQS
ncbi:MAG: lipid-A-disaccharide synthase [Chitinophagaceae bacterium]|nr:lipid-A-disaccharide synthase [Chitinophagaceae bacterium]